MDEIHRPLSRSVVDRRERENRGPVGINYIWAAYVIVGYTLLDFRPDFAGIFFMVGGIVGGIGTWLVGKRSARKEGEYDRVMARRAMLHFGVGVVLAFLGTFVVLFLVLFVTGLAYNIGYERHAAWADAVRYAAVLAQVDGFGRGHKAFA